MKKFNTILNYKEYKGQVNKQKSLTVPDQAMSIKQIMERFARGLPIEQFKPIYDENIDEDSEYLPDPRTMDLADRQEFAEQIRQDLENLRYQQAATVGLTKTENEAEKPAE
jgi:CRISPR/Cas system CSM-associated protein Csm2 small subunit